MPSHHQNGGIRPFAQIEIGVPPAIGNRLVDEDILPNLQVVTVVQIDPKALGAKHHQRNVFCYGVIESIEHASGRIVLLNLRGKLDQIGPHDLFDAWKIASSND